MSKSEFEDRGLQRHVMDELEFEPSIDCADIGVSVVARVVTLTGHVPTYAQKLDAERAAWRVKGVKAVVQKMDIHCNTDPPTDEDLARRAADLIRWDTVVPDSVHVSVTNGVVTLTGQVGWHYERTSAERCLRFLHGLKGVANQITVKPVAQPAEIRMKIIEALQRNAAVEAAAIKVDVNDGGTVTLEGNVDSWSERNAAERAAWRALGVTKVIDRLVIV